MEYANHGNTGAKTGAGLALGLFTGGSVLVYASAAGVSNNVNPGGAWPLPSVGRLEVNTAAGNAEWTGLLATPQDGMGVQLYNLGPNNLQLDSQSAGSLAANQFSFAANLTLTPLDTVILVYWVSLGFWVITA
jgi:hypothetical protein